RAYLVKEKKPERALAVFQQAIDAEWRPLYITRQHPNHVIRRRGDKDIRIVWLSTTLGKDYIDPHNLNSLSNLIGNFLNEAPRGGLGRRGTWTRSGRTLSTPLVLFLHRSGRPAPNYAEALFVSERSEDPRFQVRVSGSFFAPRIGNHEDDLPPVKGMPLSVADLEVPEDGFAGELSILVGEPDLTRASRADAVCLANGPGFERSPRELVARLRR